MLFREPTEGLCFENVDERGFSRYPSDRCDYHVFHGKRVDSKTGKVFLKHEIGAFLGNSSCTKNISTETEYLDDITPRQGMVKSIISSALCIGLRKTDEFQIALASRSRIKAEYLICRETAANLKVELNYARISFPYNEKKVHELEVKFDEADKKLQSILKRLCEIDGKFPRINMEKEMARSSSAFKSPTEELVDVEYTIAHYKTLLDYLKNEQLSLQKAISNIDSNRTTFPLIEAFGNAVSRDGNTLTSRLEKDISHYKSRLYTIGGKIKQLEEKLKIEQSKGNALRSQINSITSTPIIISN